MASAEFGSPRMEAEPSHPNSFTELEPPHKKRKEDDGKQGEKVCLVCFASPDMGMDDDFADFYHIYILDLSMPMDESAVGCDPPFKYPTLRLSDDFIAFIGYCVLGSTLYMFEHTFRDRDENTYKGKSVFAYKLPSDVSNLKLERHMLDKIPNMHGYKFGPVAVPTPDAKNILVFSTRIGKVPDDFPEDFCNFEMYNIESRSWHKLPKIPSSIADHSFRIKTHVFLENQHVMLFHTNTGMSFTLDLNLHESPFQKVLPTVPRSVLSVIDDCGFILVGGHLCLTPFYGYDIEKEVYFGFPGLPSHHAGGGCITLLHADNSECKFCVITTEMDRDTFKPVLAVSLYKVDLREYKKYGGTQVHTLKAFKFRLRTEAFEHAFRLLTLFRFQ